MKTTLAPTAFIAPFILFVVPISMWWAVMSLAGRAFEQFSNIAGIATLGCWGFLAYTLLNDVCEYTCDGQILTARNLILQTQEQIPLSEIKDLQLVKKVYRNGSHHNIIITHTKGTLTLKGLYINEMMDLYDYLKTKT